MRFFSPVPLIILGGLTSLITGLDDGNKATAVAPKSAKNTAQASLDDAPTDDTYTTFNGQKVPKIKEVGGKDLDDVIKNGYTVVKFYSPSCPHCVSVAPIWQTLYEYYWTSKPVPSTTSGDQSSLNDFHHYYGFDFANVNCIAFGDTCTKHDIQSFPIFIIFKDGELVDRMQGAKDMPGLSAFVEKTLETIRPGSRVKGGPELPEAGATSVKGFDPSSAAAAALPAKTAKASSTLSKNGSKGVKPKPKPTTIPNTLGSSVSLTAESFQTLVTMSQEPWFIKFYAPWCHHCQALAPSWAELAVEMKNKLHVGEVNCDVEQRLCKDVKLRGYPTILFFRGGERVEYDGLRGLGDLIHYANNAIGMGEGIPDVDAAEFKKMEETEEVIFVYLYDHATTNEDFAALDRLPMSLIGHAKLVKTNDPALYDRFKVTTWPRLLVSRDGRPTYYTALAPQDMRDYRRVLHWMRSVWLPIVPELTISNSQEIMDGKLVVLGILSRERKDEFLIGKNELKEAAMEWMDKQTQLFQIERQDLRDAKQLRIEEAEARNDQRALRAAKSIRIDMNSSERKEVAFAWVDGVMWERWIRTTFGILVSEGEKVVINDEDVS
jgi:protein disulfide-isomerase